jgi:hypothetical protein
LDEAQRSMRAITEQQEQTAIVSPPNSASLFQPRTRSELGSARAFGETRGSIGARANRRITKRIAESTLQEVTDMTIFPVHTMESAPESSKPALIGAMSTSPVLINSVVGLFGSQS